uniref:Uncharacterized protein n=1 Tax=Cyanothece sp. (strain PCC 7425 / ATCC 29141) TaxID=395961 RepID=B8HMZ4_CYAP4
MRFTPRIYTVLGIGLGVIGLLFAPKAIAAPPPVNQGRVYWVNNGVSTPIADNLIQFIGCIPVNNCKHFQSYIENTENLQTLTGGAAPVKGVYSIRSGFDGTFTFTCPTQQCLVWSDRNDGQFTYRWIRLVNKGEVFELSPSAVAAKFQRTRSFSSNDPSTQIPGCMPNLTPGASFDEVIQSWIGCPASKLLSTTGLAPSGTFTAPDGSQNFTLGVWHNSIWIGARTCTLTVAVSPQGYVTQITYRGAGQLLTSPKSFCRDALQGRQ